MSGPTLHMYKLPYVNHEGWAEIVISDEGFFAAISDFGNYAYRWQNFEPTDSFRRFLVGIDKEYALRKLVKERVFDEKETQKALFKCLVSARRMKKTSASDARYAFEEIIRIQEEHEYNVFLDRYWDFLDDYYETYHTMPDPSGVAFVERIWPRFIEKLKEELECESTSSATKKTDRASAP